MKRPPSASCDASCAASSGLVPLLSDIPAGKIQLASRTWRRIVSTEISSFFSTTIFPPTLNPLPQWRERAKSLPVPRGNTATAGTRRHLCSAIKFRTQPTEPWVKEGIGREKWIYRRHTRGSAGFRNGDSCEVHHRDCDLACRSLVSDEERGGNEEATDCRRDRRNGC